MKSELKQKLEQSSVPKHLHDGIEAYILRGVTPGPFLQAVILNDLFGACSLGDADSVRALNDVVLFFYNHVPLLAWGSKKLMQVWQRDRQAIPLT